MSNLDLHRAFVIDDDDGIRQFVAKTLVEHGFKIEAFQNANAALESLGSNHPVITFLDVALSQSDAIDVLIGFGAQEYEGVVHLMSGGRLPLVEAVRRLGARHGVRVAQPLSKPVDQAAIARAVAGIERSLAEPRPRRANDLQPSGM